MFRVQHLLACTSTASLLVLGLSAGPAAARPDPGSPLIRPADAAGCPLARVGRQFVRCDNLTGNGVSAPPWIPEL